VGLVTADNAALALNFAIHLTDGAVMLDFRVENGQGIPAAQAVSLLTAATQLVAEAAQAGEPSPSGPPVSMLFAIVSKGDPSMPLSIDSANAVAVFSFEDKDNDPVAPPAGVLATVTSSDTSVLTVGAAVAGTDANGVANIQFPLTEVAAGSSTLTVAATDASGNPLLGPDGVTPIPAPAPVTVTVNPGAPAQEIFTVPGN
jgi:hypothetical protein